MEITLLIILIVYLYTVNSGIKVKLEELSTKIKNLNNKIDILQTRGVSQKPLEEKEEESIFEESKSTDDKAINIIEEYIKPIISEEKEIEEPKPTLEETTTESSLIQEEESQFQEHREEPIKQVPKKSWFDNFKEKNPDLEKFIGENLINKIGVLILVLGVSFFVKYAIDKDWINEPARVGIGILCGSLVMGIAHKLKKNYAAFSSVLVAGAISIFYFTIYIAFHEYQLFSQTVAFIILSVITVFSALVSVSYNRQELAILSLIGGFAAPFMVSTGEGNYIVLFTYIAILNIGILGISYFKKWKWVTILAFIFTVVLFAAWFIGKVFEDKLPHLGALIFATLFYFIFSVTIVLSNLRNKGVFSTIEYFILVANTFFFFGMGMGIIDNWGINFKGLFTLLLAFYNLIYAGILYKKFGLDKNAIYLLIGLALTFVTLTIPIQFEGNQITIFWALEVVLLFWLSQKSKINHFKFGAIVVQILTLLSLFLDWDEYTFAKDLPVIFNTIFVSGFVVSVSLFLTYWLVRKEKNIVTKFFTLNTTIYKNIVLLVAVLVTYFTGFLEIDYQSYQFLENETSAFSFSIAYHFVFVAIVLFLVSFYKNKLATKAMLLISMVSIAAYIAILYVLPSREIIVNYVYNTNTKYAFYFHYLILGCLVYFGYQLFQKKHVLFKNVSSKKNKWLPWLFVFAIVYVLSNEVMIHGLQFSETIDTNELASKFPKVEGNYNEYVKYNFVEDEVAKTKTQIIKIGYPILWGIFSFIFLIVGIKKQWKNLRIIALSLLGLTILKLFIYDIKNVSETGKIVAFILLGVLILIISFVYQKIKKLVVDDTSEIENETK